MAKTRQNYLVHIEFHIITQDRLAKVAPRIVEAMQDVAGKDHEMAWRSLDRSVIAYVLQTSRSAAQIRARLTNPSDPRMAETLFGIPHDKIKDWGAPVLSQGDKIAVFSVGNDISAEGYGRLVGWINGHQS
jgi:hypothetical protein